MARNNKDRSNSKPAPIDYLKIIDDYNADALRLCVEHLFPLFELRVLKAQDLRKIDLKEQVLQLTEHYFLPEDSTWIYIEGLSAYLDLMVNATENSRAEKYKNRAFELLEKAGHGNNTMQNLEDALLLFIALMKPVKGQISADSKLIKDPDFSLTPEDIGIIEESWEVVEDALTSARPGLFRRRDSNENALLLYQYTYIANIIFFCRLLQQRGAFAKGGT